MPRAIMMMCLVLFGCQSDDPAMPPDASVLPPDAPAAPSCTDGRRNGDETDVDCGGGCGATCRTNARCVAPTDCATGLRCDALPSPTEDGPRSCRPEVASCAGTPCEAGAYCDVYSIDETGSILVCSLRAPIGSLCERTGDRAVNSCVDGAVCADDPANLFLDRCREALPEGAACQGQICAEGLSCLAGTCRPAKVEGASCVNDEECLSSLHCDRFHRACEPRAAAGGACYGLEAGCVTGLGCKFPAGLACISSADCGLGAMDCCATATGSECRPIEANRCEPPPGTCE